MKDIPMFTTDYGIASLILSEIPYKQIAYIHIRSCTDVNRLMEECVQFCCACGAEEVHATGEDLAQTYPAVTTLLEMTCLREALMPAQACLFPVQEHTLGRFQQIYNEKMASVPNTAYLTDILARQMLQQGDGYFVHMDGKLLGIGRAGADTIHAIAAVEKGAGEQVLRAMASVLTEETVRLIVAQTNTAAMKLYAKMGFLPVRELSRWYRIFPKEKV